MSIANITEYQSFGSDSGGRPIQAGQEPSAATQNVTFTTSTEATAFKASSRMVRVVSDSNAHIVFGYVANGTVTAVTTGTKLIADVPEYFSIPAGDVICALINA